MGLELIRLVSQWAGATAVLALLACFIAGGLALQFSRVMLAPAGEAFQLARHMALLGGAAVTTAALTSTLYWWRLGVASTPAAAAAATTVTLSAVAFAFAMRRLAGAAKTPR